jgi:hypothetical protein
MRSILGKEDENLEASRRALRADALLLRGHVILCGESGKRRGE